jgi:hypothetical protein
VSLGHIPPAVAHVACSGAMHTLVWRAGRLQTPDHRDPAAERALAALGGDPCRCVELLDAWEACSADPRALVLGPRGPEVTPAVSPESGGRGTPRRASRVPVASGARSGANMSTVMVGARRPGGGRALPAEPPADRLEQLLSLGGGGGLPHRLVATVAHALAGRVADPELHALLEAALYGRVLVALSRWLGEVPHAEVALIAPDAAPSLTLVDDGLHVRLPFGWLVDVWAPGLETLAGRFTLGAQSDGGQGWELLTVDQTMAVSHCTFTVGRSEGGDPAPDRS